MRGKVGQIIAVAALAAVGGVAVPHTPPASANAALIGPATGSKFKNTISLSFTTAGVVGTMVEAGTYYCTIQAGSISCKGKGVDGGPLIQFGGPVAATVQPPTFTVVGLVFGFSLLECYGAASPTPDPNTTLLEGVCTIT